MKKFILALDQGTTSSRAIIFDNHANIVGSAQQEFKQHYPHSGWVEHSPKDILNSQLDVAKEALDNANLNASDIASIGITNQRETTIVWDKDTGEEVYNAIVWQCRRTAEYCKSISGYEQLIYDKTGLPVDAYFSATKIKWILDNVKGAREKAENGKLLFGTIDTFLMWHLSGGQIHATDYTNASRTLLFNIHTLSWDAELLRLFNIPASMLPEVHPSSFNYGDTDAEIFGGAIPICGVAGDQQASLFGNLCVKKGMVKNTYGTGCFTLMNTGETPVISNRGLVTTLAACLNGQKPQYVLEGSVFVGGAVLQWLRDEMKLITCAREADEIAERTPNTHGVYIVPAFVGLGAPHWVSSARGTVCGLTRGSNRNHFVRAGLESIAYQVFDVIHAMERDLGENLLCLNVDGGASKSDVLMQFQSDILRVDVKRPKLIECTALGVCYLAGIQAGVWKSLDDVSKYCASYKVFQPSMDIEKRDKLLLGWEEAIAKAKYA